jgi:hypothetical protein
MIKTIYQNLTNHGLLSTVKMLDKISEKQNNCSKDMGIVFL